MKYLKRFNESLNENVVDDLIDYLSSNVIVYNLENNVLNSSDSKSEIGVRNTMTKVSLVFKEMNINIFVDAGSFSRLSYDFQNKPLLFKDMSVPSILCDNHWMDMLYMKINNELVSIDVNKQKLIYYHIFRLFKNWFNLSRMINWSKGHNKFNIGDKMDEFDVTKGNRIDLISLNSLYDYYQMTFNEREIKEYLSKSDILYQ